MKELKVLVVDDCEPMLAVMRSILANFGFESIITASDGEEGFSKFQNEKPDIVITDWHMPIVDGLDLTLWIRRKKFSVNPRVPIILMTGFTERLKIARARDIGVTEVMVKPFKAKDLARRIMHVIDAPRDFIETVEFLGPDRRRRAQDSFSGDDRRTLDPQDKI